MTTVREATIDLLRAHGFDTWFGNPGSSELSLLQDFPADMRYILGLQEMVPVGMADAYAQITRHPALVNLHTAPGVGNAMGAIYNAAMNKTPLLITAGNQRRDMQNQGCLLTNADATILPKPFVKWSAEPATAGEVPAVLAHAIHIATTPPHGPVFVSLPMDDMDVELDQRRLADIAVLRDRGVVHGGYLSESTINALAARLDAARSPVLIVGGDVERFGARDAAVALAERTGSVVWTAPFPGLSGFPENHPNYRGMLPPGAGWISQVLAGHDLIVVIGAPVFRYYPHIEGPYLPDGASLIHLTNDPDEAARAPMGQAFVTDILSATAALAKAVSLTYHPMPPARPAPTELVSTAAPLTPQALWAAARRAAPADTLWVTEAATHETAILDAIRPEPAFSHLSAAGGGLGFGAAAAVGAQLAAPHRPVICAIGDGAIHYAITALWTAARYKIPVTFVVASNTEYGILKQFGQLENTPGVPGLDLPGLDIVATATSYGVDAHHASSTDEVTELLRAGIADRDRPTLINAPSATVGGRQLPT
ncbi:benzoylformate decarboxylase [Nocardia sp. NPDC051570]|uniref:benzoylformate decarboxylase n=1 Tax=Nocardia sp. NPDC051570 TaxID=3364324 RepID=UPI0037B788F7